MNDLIKQVESALTNQYEIVTADQIRALIAEIKRLEEGIEILEKRVIEEQRKTIVGLLESCKKHRETNDRYKAALEEVGNYPLELSFTAKVREALKETE